MFKNNIQIKLSDSAESKYTDSVSYTNFVILNSRSISNLATVGSGGGGNRAPADGIGECDQNVEFEAKRSNRCNKLPPRTSDIDFMLMKIRFTIASEPAI
jgi:hypothetical protein